MRFMGLFLLCLNVLAAQHYDVVIVGGGMSGIAAASALDEDGYDVLVLESRDHIGGRTHTSFFPNYPSVKVDMGAAWIQGIDGNPLIPLAKKYGAPNKLCNYDLIDRYDTTPPLQPPPLSPLDNDPFDDLLDQMNAQIKKARSGGVEMSLQAALDPWIQTFATKIQYDLYYLLTSEIEHEEGADASDLSLLHYDDDDEFGGPDNLMTLGYQPIIDGLAANLLNKNLIRLNQVVEQITYNEEGVSVMANGIAYTADYVICTVPLGVLKNKGIDFQPPLPDWKQEAIDRINMGILDKTVLLFPAIFWDQTQNIVGRIPSIKGHWVETYNYLPFNNEPVLVAFNAGAEAQDLVENKTDAEVIENIMTVLRSIYGEQIPNPIDYVITRWGLDPHSYGSYSHLPPGATMDDYKTMAKPIGRLRFAGEATTNYPGTAHGAYLSGIREAKQIDDSI